MSSAKWRSCVHTLHMHVGVREMRDIRVTNRNTPLVSLLALDGGKAQISQQKRIALSYLEE